MNTALIETPSLIKSLSASPIDNLRWSSYLQKLKEKYPGEWSNEPDDITWYHADCYIVCSMHRHPQFGFWCGYLGLDYIPEEPESIPFHGGLTYNYAFLRCYSPAENEPLIKAWLGFDCGHLFDLLPFEFESCDNTNSQYCNLEYVVRNLLAAKDYLITRDLR
jgi:hypothetical protein